MGKADITRNESNVKPMNLCFTDGCQYPNAKGEWEKATTYFMLIPKVVRDQAGNPVDTEPMLRLMPDAKQDDKPHDQYRLSTGNQATVASVGYYQSNFSLGLSFIDYKDDAEDPFFRENPHCSTPARYLLDRLTVESQRNPALLRFHNTAEKRQAALRFARTKFMPAVIVSGGSVYGPQGEVKTRPTPAILQMSNQAYVAMMKLLCNQRVNWQGYWNPEDMDRRETLVQRFDMDAADLRNPSLMFSLATREARSGESGFGWEVAEVGPQRRTYLYGDAASSLRFAADWGVEPERFMRFMTAREQIDALFGYSADAEWTRTMFVMFAGSPYARLVEGRESEFAMAAEQNAGIVAGRSSKAQQGGWQGHPQQYAQPQYAQPQYAQPQQQYAQPQYHQPFGTPAATQQPLAQWPAQQPAAPAPQGAFAPPAQAQGAFAPLPQAQGAFAPPPPVQTANPQPAPGYTQAAGSMPLSGYGQPPAQPAGAYGHVPPAHFAPPAPAGAVPPVAPDPFAAAAVGGGTDEIPFDPASTALQGAGDAHALLNKFRDSLN